MPTASLSDHELTSKYLATSVSLQTEHLICQGSVREHFPTTCASYAIKLHRKNTINSCNFFYRTASGNISSIQSEAMHPSGDAAAAERQ